ncbi:MAG: SPOR domain-containing protein [Parvularculaceae bacterium]
MSSASDGFEDEYEEYDEFDDEDDDRGLSGLVVLLMGVVMLGAFASIVWIAFQQGIKTGRTDREDVPYVAAEPEPVKIENQETQIASNDEREVYDRLNSSNEEPVEILTEGPEEPIDRQTDDAIGAIAAAVQAEEPASEEAEDQLASLEAEDAAVLDEEEPAAEVPAPAVTEPTPARATPPAPTLNAGNPLSGSHLVQVGAFRSEDEAVQVWDRLNARMGAYLDGKSRDVQEADLGARGVFYRLRIGPFASYEAAADYCQGLKDRKQDCIVKAN